jgi:hypothetical protein
MMRTDQPLKRMMPTLHRIVGSVCLSEMYTVYVFALFGFPLIAAPNVLF